MTNLAWVAVILVSTLPDIIFDKWMGGVPVWLTWAKMVLLLGFCLSALVWKRLRPLRNFFIAMFAFFGLSWLRLQINFTWPALQALFGGSGFDMRMQAEQTGKLVASLAMIVVLLMLGYARRDFFLTRGNLRAPIEPVRCSVSPNLIPG